MPKHEICVEVVFALPDRQELVTLLMPADATVADALRQSELERGFPDADFASANVAVWGRPVSRGRQLADGDRVEILRPLEIDPRDARRELAKDGQYMSGSTPGKVV